VPLAVGGCGALGLGAVALLCFFRRRRRRATTVARRQELKEALIATADGTMRPIQGSVNGEMPGPAGGDAIARPADVSTSAGGFTSAYDQAKAVRLLGRGNSGSVYLMQLPEGAAAEGDGELGRFVVCKRCPMEEALSDEDRHSLWHEVHILSSLQHPNIIKYLHAARLEDEMRIYMEYASNGTMDNAIKAQRDAPFALPQLLRWLSQLASALRHVHAECILHRDLKTANIFLSADKSVKLGDFGISRALSTYTHFASTMVGTPYSMAPEVLDSSPYAHAADVWALGIIFFELLTLRRPFEGAHLGTLVVRITRGQYDRAALERAPHPAAVKRLASSECLLHADPEQRMRLDELVEILDSGDLAG